MHCLLQTIWDCDLHIFTSSEVVFFSVRGCFDIDWQFNNLCTQLSLTDIPRGFESVSLYIKSEVYNLETQQETVWLRIWKVFLTLWKCANQILKLCHTFRSRSELQLSTKLKCESNITQENCFCAEYSLTAAMKPEIKQFNKIIQIVIK